MVLALLVAARRDPDGDHSIERFRHFSDPLEDSGYVTEFRFEFDDGGENLFVKNIRLDLTRGSVSHETRDWISLLEFDPQLRQGCGHLLDLPEPDADRRPAELDSETSFLRTDAVGDVICLNFFRAASVNAGAFMWDHRVGESAAHNARPAQFLLRDGSGGANIGFRFEPPPKPFPDFSNRPYHCRVKMLGAHPAEAGVAFHALVLVNRRTICFGIDVNRAHGTDRDAIPACNAFLGINNHRTYPTEVELQLISRMLKRRKQMPSRLASYSDANQRRKRNKRK